MPYSRRRFGPLVETLKGDERGLFIKRSANAYLSPRITQERFYRRHEKTISKTIQMLVPKELQGSFRPPKYIFFSPQVSAEKSAYRELYGISQKNLNIVYNEVIWKNLNDSRFKSMLKGLDNRPLTRMRRKANDSTAWFVPGRNPVNYLFFRQSPFYNDLLRDTRRVLKEMHLPSNPKSVLDGLLQHEFDRQDEVREETGGQQVSVGDKVGQTPGLYIFPRKPEFSKGYNRILFHEAGHEVKEQAIPKGKMWKRELFAFAFQTFCTYNNIISRDEREVLDTYIGKSKEDFAKERLQRAVRGQYSGLLDDPKGKFKTHFKAISSLKAIMEANDWDIKKAAKDIRLVVFTDPRIEAIRRASRLEIREALTDLGLKHDRQRAGELAPLLKAKDMEAVLEQCTPAEGRAFAAKLGEIIDKADNAERQVALSRDTSKKKPV